MNFAFLPLPPAPATVNWGDGSPVQSLGAVTSPFNVSHTYASAGVYNAVVNVTDDDTGAGSDSTNGVTVNFTIVGGGVLPPINQDGTSVFKFKSTIPVKIRVQDCDGSYPSNLQISIMLVQLSGNAPGFEINEPISTSAADSGFMLRFDPSGMIYIYNLATKPLPDPSATYRIKLTIISTGQVIEEDFGLKP